jgi:MFS family permease
MTSASSVPAESRWTFVAFLICFIAAIGFAFDIYELLVLPLIVRPALSELVGAEPGSPLFQMWVGRLFFIPAFAGGFFGLLGGYLTDRLGRRRVLTWSILIYAGSAFLAGLSTSIWMLLFFRCTTFIGVCVEFVAAVAWLAELFPDPRTKERVLGYTQAFSSVGGLLVAVVNGWLVQHAAQLPAIQLPDWMLLGGEPIAGAHAPWRYTLMSGLVPALPLIVIRPFLPESPLWQQKRAAGLLKRPRFSELFAPELRRTTVVTTIMFACSYGAAFGAIQHIPQIVPGLSGVRANVDRAVSIAAREKPEVASDRQQQRKIAAPIEQKVASEYTKMQELGGLVGRFLLAMLTVMIVSRRSLLRCFQLPGLLIVPLVFWLFLSLDNQELTTIDLTALRLGELPVTTVTLGVFLAGLFTVGQFSFWGNYLPRVYPVHLRGTGESFAANIGGRMIGTSFAWVTATLATYMVGDSPPEKLAHTAALVALFVYALGIVMSAFLPEPPAGEPAD